MRHCATHAWNVSAPPQSAPRLLSSRSAASTTSTPVKSCRYAYVVALRSVAQCVFVVAGDEQLADEYSMRCA